MTLRDEILAACSEELIASRDCDAIAAKVSTGRVRPNRREIGYGTILETVGFEAGNLLCDEIVNNPNYRYVKPLLDQGRMLVGSPLVGFALQSMVPSIITQAHADKLKALGFESNPCTPQEVAAAIFNPDGSIK